MKKTKFTESQIIKAIKEAENGRPVAEVSLELGITTDIVQLEDGVEHVFDWYFKNKA